VTFFCGDIGGVDKKTLMSCNYGMNEYQIINKKLFYFAQKKIEEITHNIQTNNFIIKSKFLPYDLSYNNK
jgi:hypothetical protein